jgi:hypothetical protein
VTIVRLNIAVEVDTDRLDADMKSVAEQETVAASFPVDDQNTGWFIAQRIVDDNDDPRHGIHLDLVP